MREDKISIEICQNIDKNITLLMNSLVLLETPIYEEATKIFNESRTSNYTYEGTSMSAKFSIPAKVCSYTLKVFKAYKLLNMALIDLRIKYGDLRDNHDPGIIKPLYYN